MSHCIDHDLPRDYYRRWECEWCADWGTNVQGIPCPHCARGQKLAKKTTSSTKRGDAR